MKEWQRTWKGFHYFSAYEIASILCDPETEPDPSLKACEGEDIKDMLRAIKNAIEGGHLKRVHEMKESLGYGLERDTEYIVRRVESLNEAKLPKPLPVITSDNDLVSELKKENKAIKERELKKEDPIISRAVIRDFLVSDPTFAPRNLRPIVFFPEQGIQWNPSAVEPKEKVTKSSTKAMQEKRKDPIFTKTENLKKWVKRQDIDKKHKTTMNEIIGYAYEQKIIKFNGTPLKKCQIELDKACVECFEENSVWKELLSAIESMESIVPKENPDGSVTISFHQ